MKKIIIVLILLLLVGCSSLENKNNKNNNNNRNLNQKEEEKIVMKVKIEDKEYNANLESNETVQELLNKLPIELSMKELNGNEKYSYLDYSFKTNEYSPNTILKGDIMLYGNNCLVLFYKTFKTNYQYTKIGHIDNMEDLDNKDIVVTFYKK